MSGNTVKAAAELLDIPAEVAGGSLKLTLTGRQRLAAENHRGLLAYSPEQIIFRGQKEQAEVRGQGLDLLSLDQELLNISGLIESVSITEAGDES